MDVLKAMFTHHLACSVVTESQVIKRDNVK